MLTQQRLKELKHYDLDREGRMNEEPVRLVPTLSDADIAADLKRRAIEWLTPLLALCDEADAKGFTVGYSSAKGPLGKHVITQLVIAKHY